MSCTLTMASGILGEWQTRQPTPGPSMPLSCDLFCGSIVLLYP